MSLRLGPKQYEGDGASTLRTHVGMTTEIQINYSLMQKTLENTCLQTHILRHAWATLHWSDELRLCFTELADYRII